MANLIGNIEGFFQDLLEMTKLQEPWWLLMATIPLFLWLSLIWRKSRPDRNYRNAIVLHASVPINRQWPRRLTNALLLLIMVGLVYPAARPINNSREVKEEALLVWVYDASESMSTVDVIRGDQTVSRLKRQWRLSKRVCLISPTSTTSCLLASQVLRRLQSTPPPLTQQRFCIRLKTSSAVNTQPPTTVWNALFPLVSSSSPIRIAILARSSCFQTESAILDRNVTCAPKSSRSRQPNMAWLFTLFLGATQKVNTAPTRSTCKLSPPPATVNTSPALIPMS